MSVIDCEYCCGMGVISEDGTSTHCPVCDGAGVVEGEESSPAPVADVAEAMAAIVQEAKDRTVETVEQDADPTPTPKPKKKRRKGPKVKHDSAGRPAICPGGAKKRSVTLTDANVATVEAVSEKIDGSFSAAVRHIIDGHTV